MINTTNTFRKFTARRNNKRGFLIGEVEVDTRATVHSVDLWVKLPDGRETWVTINRADWDSVTENV